MNFLERVRFVFSSNYAETIIKEMYEDRVHSADASIKHIIDYYVKEERCNYCESKFKGFTQKFRCAYCGHYFCTKHKLPENHSCPGKLIAPPSGLREIYGPGKRIIATWGK